MKRISMSDFYWLLLMVETSIWLFIYHSFEIVLDIALPLFNIQDFRSIADDLKLILGLAFSFIMVAVAILKFIKHYKDLDK